MLYNEIIAVCSQIHTKHINTLCGQNVELLNVKKFGQEVVMAKSALLRVVTRNRTWDLSSGLPD